MTDNTDKANGTMQIILATAVVGWASVYVVGVLGGMTWAIVRGEEPLEVIKSQFNWMGGAIFGYVVALLQFAFPGTVGNLLKDRTLATLANKTSPPTVSPKDITPKEFLDGKAEQAGTTPTTGAGLAAGDQSGAERSDEFAIPDAPWAPVGKEGKPDL